jgi:hypothetical protein
VPQRPQQPKPKINPRLAKGRQLAALLDDAECHVNWSMAFKNPPELKRRDRRTVKQTYRSLVDFTCSGDVDCECMGCHYEVPDLPIVVKSVCLSCIEFKHPAITRALTTWLAEASSFDEFYSRVIGTFPDSYHVREAILPRIERLWKKYLDSFENQEDKS